MTAEAKRMLWWVCGSWVAVFAVAVAACIAHDAVSTNLSNKLLLVSAFIGVVAGIEVKRGWIGFGLLLVSGSSAFFLGSATGLEYLRLVMHSTHWFNGVIRATVLGGLTLGISIAALGSYLKRPSDPSGPMPHESAAKALEWLDARDRQEDEDQRRRKVQLRLQQILIGLAFAVTVAVGAWRLLGFSFWISALPAVLLGAALILLSEKISSATMQKIFRSHNVDLEHMRARTAEVKGEMRKYLVAKAAEEASQQGEDP